MYQKIRKMRKNSMKDKDYFNPVNHTRLIGWIIIISSNIGWWVCVWYMGFFITILWTIIGIALYMLWWNLKDMRAQMETIIFIIVLSSLVSLIICAYGKQQEKHNRMREWIKEVKKQRRKND